MSKKNLPAVVQADNEELFLAALNARAEANRRGAELARMQRALVHSEMLRAEEKRAAQREMDGLVKELFSLQKTTGKIMKPEW